MNNKSWYEETKEMFFRKIDDIPTLHRAVGVIEDREELLKENLKLQQELTDYKERNEKAIEYINNFPLIHYASSEKIDDKRLSGKLVPVDELLEILDKKEVSNDNNN